MFWRLFLRYFPRHVPMRLGNGVNPSVDFDPKNLDVVLKHWNRRDLSFHGDHLSLLGQVLRPRPSCIRRQTEIFVYAFEDDPGAVKAFIYELSDAFAADYATAHILTKDQERRKLQARVERAWLKSPALAKKYEEQMKKNLEEWPKRRALGPEITAINVKRGCIAELNWLNVFGPPYVALFGRERLLATPAHEVRQLPYGGIGVEITDGLEETPDAWERLAIARTRAKEHLDNNAFCNPSLPLTHVYNSPK